MEILFKKYGLTEEDIKSLQTKINTLKQPKPNASKSKNHTPIQIWDKFTSIFSNPKKKQDFINAVRKADAIFQ